MLLVLIGETTLREGTVKEVKRRREHLNFIIWFIVLTFPIWLYWFGELAVEATTHPPIEIYLILIPGSYYAIFAFVPRIGVPWLLVVIFLGIMEIRKWWVRRQIYRAQKKGAVGENTSTSSSEAK
jgi:hypothetical protein